MRTDSTAGVAGDIPPEISTAFTPPLLHGVAAQAHLAYAGRNLEALLQFNNRPVFSAAQTAALTLDNAVALHLRFRPTEAAALQRQALALAPLFRVANCFGAQTDRPLRLLAVMAPGGLMVNTPLDFITQHLDVRLDLLFVVPDQALPAAMPEHDVAFFAVGEATAAEWRRLDALFRAWPRPALNRPARIARLSRDAVARGLADCPGLCSPPVAAVERAALLAHLRGARWPMLQDGPVLIRPIDSHAGRDLARIADDDDLAQYLDSVAETAFFVTRFVDYRGSDGMHRKYRVAMIDRQPYLCHMASSPHWMVHYLNAGMEDHAERRAEEARAMAGFESGFARRHAAALAALQEWMDLDYFQIDCAETADGRLLVFEVDVAAIVHMMDPPEVFPYKAPQMRRVFAAFEAMLRRRAGARQAEQILVADPA